MAHHQEQEEEQEYRPPTWAERKVLGNCLGNHGSRTTRTTTTTWFIVLSGYQRAPAPKSSGGFFATATSGRPAGSGPEGPGQSSLAIALRSGGPGLPGPGAPQSGPPV